MTKTRAELFSQARAAFTKAFFPEAAFDARVLVAGILGLETGELVLRGDTPASAAEIAKVEDGIRRRLAHEPVHRILGAREFYGLHLTMSYDTLEPRPDTEILVDTILKHIPDKSAALSFLDLGTGTGAICLSLLSQLPNARGQATDISADAVVTATANAAALGFADRFHGFLSDWFLNVEGQFDFIVSNPPYIASSVVVGLDQSVRGYDPLIALDGGADGLVAYRAIAAHVGQHLRPGGFVAVEIGFDQHDSVRQIFETAGFMLDDSAKDLGGQDRVLLFRRKQAI
jgi:release factor glutamine methyltransferase